MELLIKRNQDKGMLGGIKFTLFAKVELTSEEEALIKKYKAHKEVLFTGKNRQYTINDLLLGDKTKCKDVTVLLENEKVYKNACQYLKTLLDVMKSFGGEERILFDDDQES